MCKAVLYSRVSTQGQAELGVSLEMQRDKLRAQAALHDYDVVAELSDEVSGSTLDRPEMQRALQMLRDGDADTLVVYKLDRLTRSISDFQTLLEEFFQHDHFSLVSINDSIDTRTATGRLVLNVMMSVFQWERESIGERTKDGLRHKRVNGDVYCKRLYGYEKIDGRFVPDESEQVWVRHIVDERDNGRAFSSIASGLNVMEVPPPSGKQWYHHTVKAVYEREKNR